MEECLTIFKNLLDKHVTVMKKNSYIYEACWHKTNIQQFCLSTDGPIQHVKRLGHTTYFKPQDLKMSTVILLLETLYHYRKIEKGSSYKN